MMQLLYLHGQVGEMSVAQMLCDSGAIMLVVADSLVPATVELGDSS